jgi:hypothetical protein
MTNPISNSSHLTDPMLALALLMLENDHSREQSDAVALARARDEQRRAMNDAVRALHDAADAVANGALLQGGLSLAGGAASCTGAVGVAARAKNDSTPLLAGLSSGGNAALTLGAPAFALVGEAPQLEAEAEAKAAEQRRTQASWAADDASESRARTRAGVDHTLDAVENALDAQHQANIAVLSNY